MNNEIKETLDYINDRVIPNEKWEKIKDYITYSEKEIKELREAVDRLTNKEYKKDDSHLGIVRTKEQLERMQSLLCFKSKVEITDILIDTEEKIDKAIKLLKEAGCYDEETKTFCDDIWEELPDILSALEGRDK